MNTETNNTISMEDQVLTNLMMNNTPVTMFLMNGFQMRGTIKQFDKAAVMLNIEGRSSMIYKHAISTIQPNYPSSNGSKKTQQSQPSSEE